jgi:glycerophosphoryl diester phosphodiesterase
MATRVKIPPENTLACFEYALAQGCDGFEFDVRVSRDERLVLCHNASLRGLKIDVCSFEMLCSICDERVACLEDVLSAFGDRAYLDIEVKVAGSEELTLEALRRAKPRRYLVSSFLPEVLLRLHQLDPSLPLGYICDGSEYVRAWRELPIQVFLPQQKLVTEQLVREAHRRELQIFTWTVNREQDMTRLAAWGVDGLISDHPDLLCRTFQRLACPGQRPTGKS